MTINSVEYLVLSDEFNNTQYSLLLTQYPTKEGPPMGDSRQTALEVFIAKLPAEKARVRQQYEIVPASERVKVMVSRNNFGALAAFTPQEIAPMVLASQAVVNSLERPFHFKEQFSPIDNRSAQELNEAYRSWCKKNNKPWNFETNSPNLAAVNGQWYRRNHVAITNVLPYIVDAILSADNDDVWKREALINLGACSLAKAIILNAESEKLSRRLFELFNFQNDVDQEKLHLAFVKGIVTQEQLDYASNCADFWRAVLTELSEPQNIDDGLYFAHLEALEQLGAQSSILPEDAQKEEKVDLDDVFSLEVPDSAIVDATFEPVDKGGGHERRKKK